MSMTYPILYSFRRCPYAMRARLALASAQIPCELREIILREKPVSMLEFSPKGTVPVLILPNTEEVIDESLDIMFWALKQNDPENLLSIDNSNVQRLITETDHKFKPHLDRYKYSERYDEQIDTNLHRQKCCAFLQTLNEQLEGKKWLFGHKICLADIAILPFIRQFRLADTEWFNAYLTKQPEYTNIIKWLMQFLNSDRLSYIMEKYSPWHTNDTPTIFPNHL